MDELELKINRSAFSATKMDRAAKNSTMVRVLNALGNAFNYNNFPVYIPTFHVLKLVSGKTEKLKVVLDTYGKST